MPVTQEQLDALTQAIADGVRQVTVRGVTTTYNTTDSLIRARDRLQTQFNNEQATAASRRISRRTLNSYGGRGYCE